jgi:hypothetical protein
VPENGNFSYNDGFSAGSPAPPMRRVVSKKKKRTNKTKKQKT